MEELPSCEKMVAVQAILCPVCKMALVPSTALELGQHVLCPYCKNKFAYGPMAEKVVRFRSTCPFCKDIVESEAIPASGQVLLCPSCNNKFQYPDATDDGVRNHIPPTTASLNSRSTRRAASPGSNNGKIISVCPHCGVREEVERKYIGETATCDECGKDFIIGGARQQRRVVGDRKRAAFGTAGNMRRMPMPPQGAYEPENDGSSPMPVLAFLLGLLFSLIGVLIAVVVDKRNLKASLLGLVGSVAIWIFLILVLIGATAVTGGRSDVIELDLSRAVSY